MSHSLRLVRRALITPAAAGTLCIGSWAGIAPASAHVHVNADDPARGGGTTIITFQVPNESETGKRTTAFSVLLPNLSSASTDVMPAWTAKLDKDAAAGTVQGVTWTAAPSAGIPADQFELFEMLVTLPDADTVSFPAIQTYEDGTVVRWDQPPLAGGGEPERPAPMLTLVNGGPAPEGHHAPPAGPAEPAAPTPPAPAEPQESKLGPDNVARALAGGALLLGALGVGIALTRRKA
jgi:uncharacterized protein YcnI